jgi:hypothetical protein
MLPFGKDSKDEECLYVSKREYKLVAELASPIANKDAALIRIKPEPKPREEDSGAEPSASFGESDDRRLMSSRARLIYRQENIDWFVAMSFLKDISIGTIIQ